MPLQIRRPSVCSLHIGRLYRIASLMWYNEFMSRCDGIGRRDGLKIRWWQHRAGSTPATGTTIIAGSLVRACVFLFALVLIVLITESVGNNLSRGNSRLIIEVTVKVSGSPLAK